LAPSSSTDSVRILPGVLRAFAIEALRTVGLPDADAQRVANCLVQVDLRGVFSHGTRQLRRYTAEYQRGELNPHPEIRVDRETPASAVIDGDGGIGYLAASRAAEVLVQKAGDVGIAVTSTHRHGHIGSAGIYARMVVARDMVYFGAAGGSRWNAPGDPDVTVWKAMSAPPICFGIPSAEGPPLVADINTHMFRDWDRLDEAMERFPEALIRSMGLKFVATLLGGVLGGSLPEGEEASAYKAAARGSFMVAVRPDVVGDTAAFKAEVTRIIAESRELKPLPGLETTEVAGSLEWQRERTWSNDGIPISRAHLDLLEEVARNVGISATW
jgi:L-2-hydroxycarboxylate dehydrogenase (NAD+)